MPKKPIPEKLRLFEFHGLELKKPSAGSEWLSDCPFCGKQKFHVNDETTMYKCWSGSCGEEGNDSVFLKRLWEHSFASTTETHYEQLCDESGWLYINSPRSFGCAVNPVNGDWIVPGYNVNRSLTGLYRFCPIKDEKTKKWTRRLLPTPGRSHHLFNLHNYEDHRPIVDVLEGWRDAISWIEATGYTYHDSDEHVITNRNIIAMPGTNVFKQGWGRYFAGKVVNIMFDNDWPKKNPNTGNILDGAGLKGAKRLVSLLIAAKDTPKEINVLCWNDSEAVFSKRLSNKKDMREFLHAQETTGKQRTQSRKNTTAAG